MIPLHVKWWHFTRYPFVARNLSLQILGLEECRLKVTTLIQMIQNDSNIGYEFYYNIFAWSLGYLWLVVMDDKDIFLL